MAKVKRYSYGENNWTGDAAQGKSFFDSLNATLIKSTTLEDGCTFSLNIDNVLSVKYWGGTSNPNHGIKLIYNSEETTIGDISSWGIKTFTVTYNDNFLKIDSYSANPNNHNTCFIYEKIGEQIYYGSNSYLTDHRIENIPIKKPNTEVLYKHIARLNYPTESGYLDYSAHVLFLADGQKTSIIDTYLLSTSTITFGTVVSFGGKNYYALGTNSIIELDAE